MVPKAEADEYDFFDHMDIGPIYKAVKCANNDSTLESTFGNKTLIECNNPNFNIADTKVCKKFNKLIGELCTIKSSSKVNNSLIISDYDYLKFWINLTLKEEDIVGNATMDEFALTMNDEYKECFSKDAMKNIFNSIEHNFKKIKILDKLYKDYYEMHEIVFSSRSENIRDCLTLSKKCVEEYKAAINGFRKTKDNFYNALMKFENKYIQHLNDALGKDKSFEMYIDKIPAAYQISDLTFYSYERNKIIFMSLIGAALMIIFILIYFYMVKSICTPFGSRLRARSRNKKNKFCNQDDNNNSLYYFNNYNHLNTHNGKYNIAYHSA